MKVTAENLDSILTEHGNLTLVRSTGGDVHVGRLRRTETVEYGTPRLYGEDTRDVLMQDLDGMPSGRVALVHLFPNRPPEHRYSVKYGEVY